MNFQLLYKNNNILIASLTERKIAYIEREKLMKCNVCLKEGTKYLLGKSYRQTQTV